MDLTGQMTGVPGLYLISMCHQRQDCSLDSMQWSVMGTLEAVLPMNIEVCKDLKSVTDIQSGFLTADVRGNFFNNTC
jgi:hypothetical protein